MAIRFHKMHGLGNDFIIIDVRTQLVQLTSDRVRWLCDRHVGVGCDQLVVLTKPTLEGATVRVQFYNPDGSEAGACGNASRCVALLLGAACVLQTRAGLLPCSMHEDRRVTVDMGRPQLDWSEIPLSTPCDTLSLPLDGAPSACAMGNPHVTFFSGTEGIIVKGPALESNPLFPERANIGFAEIESRQRIQLRVWERGAGLTRACGSGACAAVVNGVRRGVLDRHCHVVMDGGGLEIHYRDDGHVLMTGPACHVFAGELLDG